MRRARRTWRPGVAEVVAALVLLPLLVVNALRAFDDGERLLGLLNLAGCLIVLGLIPLLDSLASAAGTRVERRPSPRVGPPAASGPWPRSPVVSGGGEGRSVADAQSRPSNAPSTAGQIRPPISSPDTGGEQFDDRR